MDNEDDKQFPLPARPYVAIENPISEERSVLRQTLLPNMLDIAASNLRHTNRIAFFEIGQVFLQRAENLSAPDELPEDTPFALPLEPRRLGVVMTGPCTEATWQLTQAKPSKNGQSQPTDFAPLDFYDLKGVIEELTNGLHLREVSYTATSHPMLHPGRAAVVR